MEKYGRFLLMGIPDRLPLTPHRKCMKGLVSALRPGVALCLLVILVGITQTALAAQVTVTVTVTITGAVGADTADLNGETLTFVGTFSDGTMYVGTGGFALATAASHSLTIPGTSASSGVYSDPVRILIRVYSPIGILAGFAS